MAPYRAMRIWVRRLWCWLQMTLFAVAVWTWLFGRLP